MIQTLRISFIALFFATLSACGGGGGGGGQIPESSTITVPLSRFSKIASTGQPLSNQTALWSDAGTEAAGTQWDCVRDSTTGLIWENKSTNASSLRYKGHTYTWYTRHKVGSGEPEGLAIGGTCTGLTGGKCNSEAYVKAVNDARLCGGTGWRAPTVEELKTLQRIGVQKGTSPYFPNIETLKYWDITSYGFDVFDFANPPINHNYYYYYDESPSVFGPYAMMLVRSDTANTVAVDDLNKVNASKSNPSVYESINLWVSNVRDSVTSVLWHFGGGVADVVMRVVDGSSELLSYFFTIAGEQTVQVDFRNASDQSVSSASKSFNVQPGVPQTADVTAVLNDTLKPAVRVISGDGTNTRRPLIKIKTSVALTTPFSVSLFNGNKDAEILCDATSTDQQNWELRPKQDLPLGSYSLKAAVKRMDGVLGTLIGDWNIVIGVLNNGLYQAASVGSNAHIGQITLQGASVVNVRTFEATITPKLGTFSAPVKITWSRAALQSRNLIPTANIVKIPVFGLYANYANQVSVKLTFASGNPQTLSPLTITTLAGPTPMIGDITVKTARTASSGALGYDFIMSRGFASGSPVILDTDGNIRWTYTHATNSVISGDLSPTSSAWYDNGFLIGDSNGLNMVRMNLDGSTQLLPVDKYQKYLGASNFHHNMEKGKTGYLGLYDRAAGTGKQYTPLPPGVNYHYYDYDENDVTFTAAVDSDVVEFDPLTGNIIKSWDLKKILNDYMTSQGDTNTLLFNAESWFHANAAAYDASDNTIVVSSRQNFLIKLKYDTGEIVWIFGDPRKYWYTIPSLQAKALTLDAGGTYPLGQHAVSIPAAGKIMVFNNGNISGNGHQVGANEKLPNPLHSVVSYYTVNASAKTARQDWQYDHPEGLYSNVCSSAYMAPDQSLLVLYAIPQRMVGLDANKNIVFDFAYSDTRRCSAFNATPVPFGNLNFTR